MTRQLLWEEYAQTHPEAHYSYSRFTVLFRRWCQAAVVPAPASPREEKLFVDYRGPAIVVVNPDTGELREAQVLVAVPGASSYTYAGATWSQPAGLDRFACASLYLLWRGAGGVVPDNLKGAVSKACRYEPDLNPTYQQLAEHYGVAVIPARPYKPKDKAKAEVGVQRVKQEVMIHAGQTTLSHFA